MTVTDLLKFIEVGGYRHVRVVLPQGHVWEQELPLCTGICRIAVGSAYVQVRKTHDPIIEVDGAKPRYTKDLRRIQRVTVQAT